MNVTTTRAWPYSWENSLTGVFVEIYLPKKTEFQGTLYETLTQGFDIAKVRRHFNSSKKRPKIKKTLERFKRVSGYSATSIKTLDPCFRGYSIYEVDGVFFNPERNKAEAERTQVIRVMFVPPLEKLGKVHRLEAHRIRALSRQGLRHHSRATDFVKEYNESRSRPLLPKEVDFVCDLERWSDGVALFVFGYLVFEICEHIVTLLGDARIEKAEDEIWVVSFWNLVVNKIVFHHKA